MGVGILAQQHMARENAHLLSTCIEHYYALLTQWDSRSGDTNDGGEVEQGEEHHLVCVAVRVSGSFQAGSDAYSGNDSDFRQGPVAWPTVSVSGGTPPH